MKDKSKEIIDESKNIVPFSMSSVLIDAFNRYAKTVITDRAIPDARDGLKPVQRRIIYDMFDQGFLFSKPTVKSATIVGHVMGHYHPHGDTSIYDALVHMSQSWKMAAPLIDFQGNNGSIDDDGPAAYRYTEARLSSLSEYLVEDLYKETVEMIPTFDDKLFEPVVLPAKFPNLLVNGTSGIAVGSSTYIPSNNLNEIIEATMYRINHKRTNLDDLLEFVHGPDFPTGGIIDDKEAIRTIYETGKGSFFLYCKVDIEEDTNTIVISQIPFGVTKSSFVSDLVKRKENDNLDNIDEIIDESSKEDIRITIKVRDGSNPNDVLNYLQSKGSLRTTISCNFLAIDKGHPKTMSLLELIDVYISHQREVKTRSLKFDLNKAELRLEIVEGLIRVVSIIDEVVEKIRKLDGKESVKRMLQDDYHFTERQSEAIAMLPLYRLSNTDIVELTNEKEELNNLIIEYKAILSDPDKLDKEIYNLLKEINKKFTIERKTQILDEKQVFNTVDTTKLIAKEDAYVVGTFDGYFKRSNYKSYKASIDSSDPNSIPIPKLKPGDQVIINKKTNTHSTLLLFTNFGNYLYVPIYLLSDMKWKEEGKHLNNICNLSNSEKIVKAFVVDEFIPGLKVVILTKNNKIKRVDLTEFNQGSFSRKPLRACKFSDKDDKVVGVCITSGNSTVVIVDELGHASRYNENEIPLVSTSAVGVKAIASGIDHAKMVSLLSYFNDESSYLFVVSDKRAARLISSNKIPVTTRLGPKTHLIKILKKNPWKIVEVSKVLKSRVNDALVGLITPSTTISVNINEFDPSDIGMEMRENLKGFNKEDIIGRHHSGLIIDKSTMKVEKPSFTIPSEQERKAEVKEDDQLSLFDLFEKINNK